MTDGNALLIVDVQNDFCPGGALPVPQGDTIVPVLNVYIEAFTQSKSPIIASRDWHPLQSRHFRDNGGPWPAHCVQGTPGAEFHPGLELPESVIVISKGTEPHTHGYTAFEGCDAKGLSLASLLVALQTQRLFVGGLATDYCVRATVLDALASGFRVGLLTDAVRGIDKTAGDSRQAVREMGRRGAALVTLAKLDVRPGFSKGDRQ